VTQYAVVRRESDWQVFKDGLVLAGGMTRSAAIELAKTLAFDAEERGEPVETLIQGYYGELSRKLTGGAVDNPPT
jgi:hypothetical protein